MGAWRKYSRRINCNCELQLMKRENVRQARGRVQPSVQPIKRSAWFYCNSSLGTPPLSHFIHHPPPP
ncbi:hypothetical protein Hanom_Chr06g00518111 [Helianthus anomalus]